MVVAAEMRAKKRLTGFASLVSLHGDDTGGLCCRRDFEHSVSRG